jgi:hypothetical protein
MESKIPLCINTSFFNPLNGFKLFLLCDTLVSIRKEGRKEGKKEGSKCIAQ